MSLMSYVKYDIDHTYLIILHYIALCGQLIGVELVDDGLYFGIEGDSFRFPSQLTQMKLLRHALEVIYFFKVKQASLL